VLATPKDEAAKPFLDEFSGWAARMFEKIEAGDAPGAVAAYVSLSGATAWEGLSAQAKAIYLENARTLLLAAADKTNGRPSCETFGTMPVPTLVLAGERTPKAIELMNEAVLACLPPGTEYAKVPKSGHYWYADNPAEAARRLDAFFRRH
jgi:pimeloyl-ACP methyl ester carboxylesterase